MSETLESKDVTEMARVAGYAFPADWTVTASTEADIDSDPYDADCYSPQDIAAWKADEWQYVGLIVTVADEDGHEWGSASIWGVDDGFPLEDGTTTSAIGRVDLLPDLITQAGDEANKSAAAFVGKWSARARQQPSAAARTSDNRQARKLIKEQPEAASEAVIKILALCKDRASLPTEDIEQLVIDTVVAREAKRLNLGRIGDE